MRVIRTTAAAACGLAAMLGSAAAEGWAPSRGGFARFGLISQTCDSDGHARFCLALACPAGHLELVSAAGGGGPMEGATTIRFAGRTARATFAFDERAVDVMGIAAARARVPPDLLEAMASADRIELSAPNAGVTVRHRFSGQGLGRALRRATAACARRGGRRP